MILPFLIVLCLMLFAFFVFRARVTSDLPGDIRQDGFWLRPGTARKGQRLHLRWLDQKGKWHDENIVFHPGPNGQFVPTQRRPLQIKLVQPQSYQSSSSSSSFSNQDSWVSSSSSSSSDSYTPAAVWESSSPAPSVDAQGLSDAAPLSSSDSSYPSAY